jgi:hypothetical protein
VNSRTACALNSTGESMKYWTLGAVKTSGSSVGNNWVETRQVRPGGCVKRTRIGVSASDGAHANVAGALRCACVPSTAAYVPSTWSPNNR